MVRNWGDVWSASRSMYKDGLTCLQTCTPYAHDVIFVGKRVERDDLCLNQPSPGSLKLRKSCHRRDIAVTPQVWRNGTDTAAEDLNFCCTCMGWNLGQSRSLWVTGHQSEGGRSDKVTSWVGSWLPERSHHNLATHIERCIAKISSINSLSER